MKALKCFKLLGVCAAAAFLAGCGSEETQWKPSSVNTAPDTPTFTDSRDNKVYKTVKIGTQTWMAQHLDYDAPNSATDVCYEDNAAYCSKYGRLYDWKTALTACPAGYHLPSDEEWTTLANYTGGSSTVGAKLKSASGWNYNGNGTDDYGFFALPGGLGNSGGGFYDAGDNCYFWSATESSAGLAWNRGMDCIYDYASRYKYDKSNLFSVRCVRDSV